MTAQAHRSPAERIAPGVAAIISDEDGRILLHRRKVGAGWAPPSSGIAAGRSVEEALRDCVERETGLRVAVDRLVGVYSDPAEQVVDYRGGRVHWVTSVVACHLLRGPVHDCDEGGPWRWVDAAELPPDVLPYARRWIADALAYDAGVVR